MRKRLHADGVALTERLCVYPQYLDAEWVAQGVLDTVRRRYWSFIPRGGSGRREAPFAINADLVGPATEKARHGERLTAQELTAMFAETRPEAIEALRVRGRRAARRACGGDGDLRRQPQHQRLEHLHRRLRVLRLRPGPQVARTPTSTPRREFRARVAEAVAYGASELCIQSGIHPDWALEDYLHWLRVAREEGARHGADLHLHAYSPMEIAHMCDISGLPPAEVFARLADAGLGSTPGTAAEVLHDGVRERISPNKLPVARWVEIIEASHGAGLRVHVDGDVRAHRGAVGAGRAPARHPRPAGTDRRDHGVRAAVVHPVPHAARAHARDRGDLARRRTSSTRRCSGSRWDARSTNLQASWVKMGLDAATEALRWGVNDLGGTLMEESISRLAGSHHGVRLDPPDLAAAAHRAGRPAAERSTLYGIRERYPVGVLPESPLDHVATGDVALEVAA